MTSRLNPEAAVFIPVSPTSLIMIDEAIITASPGVKIDEATPLTPEYSSSPKQVDYFMRDNFSTIPNKIKELSTHVYSVPEFTINSHEHMEHISIDKLLGIQSMKQTELTKEMEKTSGEDSILIDIEDEITNIVGNNKTNIAGLGGRNEVSEMITNIINQSDVLDNEIISNIISPKDMLLQGLTQKKKRKSSRNRNRRRYKKFEPTIVENNDGFITEQRRTPPIDLTFKPIQNFRDDNPFEPLQTSTIITPATTPTDDFYNLADLYKTPLQSPQTEEASCEPKVNQQDIITNTTPSFISSRSPVDEKVVPFEELKPPKDLPSFMHPPNANRIIISTELPKSPETDDTLKVLQTQSSENIEIDIKAENKIDLDGIKHYYNFKPAKRNKKKSFSSEKNPMHKSLSSIDLDSSEQFLRPEYTISKPKKDRKPKSKKDSKEISLDEEFKHDSLKPKVEEQIVPEFDDSNNIPGECNTFSETDSKSSEVEIVADKKINDDEVVQEVLAEDSSNEVQETSFIIENAYANTPLIDIDAEVSALTGTPENNETSNISDVKEENLDSNDQIDCNIKDKTKTMTLELQDQVPTSQATPEELRNLVQGFEVIDKDELIQENYPPVEPEGNTSKPYQDSTLTEKAANLDHGKCITLHDSDLKHKKENDISDADDKLGEGKDLQLDDSHFAAELPPTSIETTYFNNTNKEEPKLVSVETISEVDSHLQNPPYFPENKQYLKKEVVQSPTKTAQKSTQSDVASERHIEAEAPTTLQEDVQEVPPIKMTDEPQVAEPSPTSLPDANNGGKQGELELPEQEISKTAPDAESEVRDSTPSEEESVEPKQTPHSDNQTTQPQNQDQPAFVESPPTKTTSVKPVSDVKSTAVSATTGKSSVVKPTLGTASKPTPSGGAKTTNNSVATSKSSAAASKPSASSTASSKPASGTPSKSTATGVGASKSTAPSVASTKSTTSSTPSKTTNSVSSPKSSSVTASKTVTSTSTTSKTTASATLSKPTPSTVSSPKPATSNVVTPKPTAVSKPATTTKPTAPTTPVKKSVAPVVKPTGSKTATPSLTKPAVTSTNTAKPVPKQLSVETTALKTPSKPSSPTSPTTPKSPVMKPAVAPSSPKAGEKSVLPAKSPTASKLVKDKPLEKKTPTSTDTKLSAKKIEAPKSSAAATVKPATPAKPSASGAKPISSITKPQTPTPNKATAAKPAAASTTKPKPVGTSEENSNVLGSAGVKKSPTTVAKPTEKIIKELGAKPAATGKPTPAKAATLKTESKGISKTGEKSVTSKKNEDGKKQAKSVQLQELKVTTTNEINQPVTQVTAAVN